MSDGFNGGFDGGFDGFGMALAARGRRIAAMAKARLAAAVVADAEADAPPGVRLESDADGVTLAGANLRRRYWGGMARSADAGLRAFILRLIERKGA